jgi:excisionase family DNA binding protein
MERHGAPRTDQVVLLTPGQAGERLGCSLSHVRRLISRGELRAIDVAGAGSRRTKLRVRSDDLAWYIDSRTPTGPVTLPRTPEVVSGERATTQVVGG